MATIRKSRLYAYPIEELWYCMTDSDSLGRWLMKNDFVAEVGHEFQFRTDPAPGFDGIVDCQVLELDPPHQISMSWRGGGLDTVLTVRLEKVANGTRLSLEHAGFVGLKQRIPWVFLSLGWGKILRKMLSAELAGEPAIKTECK